MAQPLIRTQGITLYDWETHPSRLPAPEEFHTNDYCGYDLVEQAYRDCSGDVAGLDVIGTLYEIDRMSLRARGQTHFAEVSSAIWEIEDASLLPQAFANGIAIDSNLNV